MNNFQCDQIYSFVFIIVCLRSLFFSRSLLHYQFHYVNIGRCLPLLIVQGSPSPAGYRDRRYFVMLAPWRLRRSILRSLDLIFILAFALSSLHDWVVVISLVPKPTSFDSSFHTILIMCITTVTKLLQVVVEVAVLERKGILEGGSDRRHHVVRTIHAIVNLCLMKLKLGCEGVWDRKVGTLMTQIISLINAPSQS